MLPDEKSDKDPESDDTAEVAVLIQKSVEINCTICQAAIQ
jgi:hypothetical protein